MKANLQVNISFGDYPILTPKSVVFPTLLEMAAPVVLAYSTEAIIAEKFEVMISVVELDERMKVFYDVYSLSTTQNFEGKCCRRLFRKSLIIVEH